MRDWNGERFLKKIRENKRLRLFGGESRSYEKPGPQNFLRTHPEKKYDIIL